MDIVSKIDHSILRPEYTDGKLIIEIDKIKHLNIASVCVKPYHIKLAGELLKNSHIKVGTVIGFPHGSNTINIKKEEIQSVLIDGAQEVDFVINIGKLLSGDFEYTKQEIEMLGDIVSYDNNLISKVIIETSLLDDEHIRKVCEIVLGTNVDYIKTSTGFGATGAQLRDINLIKSIVGNKKKIKASGNIKSRESAELFISMGCDRIGTSATLEIINGTKV